MDPLSLVLCGSNFLLLIAATCVRVAVFSFVLQESAWGCFPRDTVPLLIVCTISEIST